LPDDWLFSDGSPSAKGDLCSLSTRHNCDQLEFRGPVLGVLNGLIERRVKNIRVGDIDGEGLL
jgi:hypothetical protein